MLHHRLLILGRMPNHNFTSDNDYIRDWPNRQALAGATVPGIIEPRRLPDVETQPGEV